MGNYKPVSVQNADHYNWGQNNDGWHLLKDDNLSVIEEIMHPGTSERLHFHSIAQQLFYILSGEAVFEVESAVVYAAIGESVHIPAGTPHRIYNSGQEELRFLVISSPGSHGDRTDVNS